MVEYKIEFDIAKIGNNGKQIKLVSWEGRKPKIDIRSWIQVGEDIRPGKGITLTEEEAEDLGIELVEYYGVEMEWIFSFIKKHCYAVRTAGSCDCCTAYNQDLKKCCLAEWAEKVTDL